MSMLPGSADAPALEKPTRKPLPSVLIVPYTKCTVPVVTSNCACIVLAFAALVPPKSHTPSHVTYAMLPICSNLIVPLPTIDGVKSCQPRLHHACGALRNVAGTGVHAVPLPVAAEMKPFEHTVSDVVEPLAPTGIGC